MSVKKITGFMASPRKISGRFPLQENSPIEYMCFSCESKVVPSHSHLTMHFGSIQYFRVQLSFEEPYLKLSAYLIDWLSTCLFYDLVYLGRNSFDVSSLDRGRLGWPFPSPAEDCSYVLR